MPKVATARNRRNLTRYTTQTREFTAERKSSTTLNTSFTGNGGEDFPRARVTVPQAMVQNCSWRKARGKRLSFDLFEFRTRELYATRGIYFYFSLFAFEITPYRPADFKGLLPGERPVYTKDLFVLVYSLKPIHIGLKRVPS